MSGRVVTSRRLAIAALCLLSLAVCCWLAWWQWGRFQSAGGSFQNLGYVLQWPLFGLFPAFMVWRLRTLRAQHRDQPVDRTGPAEPPHRPPPAPSTRASVTEDREDAELAAYNRMLAALNARDQENR